MLFTPEQNLSLIYLMRKQIENYENYESHSLNL